MPPASLLADRRRSTGRGRDGDCSPPTGSSEAVARPRLPQNVACGFPALRSSNVGSQCHESLQRLMRQPQLWSQQRGPLLEAIEVRPGEVAARPATATKHLAPVTLDGPVHLLQSADI